MFEVHFSRFATSIRNCRNQSSNLVTCSRAFSARRANFPYLRGHADAACTGCSIQLPLQQIVEIPGREISRGLYTASWENPITSYGLPPATYWRSNSLAPSLTPAPQSYPFPAPRMTATKIDGTSIAKEIRETLKENVRRMREVDATFAPSMTIVQGLADLAMHG